MSRCDNYPDNIRDFDHDPRSPFFNEPDQCDVCGHDLLIEIEEDLDGKYKHVYCVNIYCSECADFEGEENE